MKKRVFALCLALALLVCLVPGAAAAETDGICGTWSSEKFWRSGRFTYPYVFDETLIGCSGFTLDYEIAAVSAGSLDGNFIFETYICDTLGNWTSVASFALQDQKATVDVQLNSPMSIQAVAVICQKKANITYSHNLTVRDVRFRGTASGAYAKAPVSGSWDKDSFAQDHRAAMPYVFDAVQKDCGGFTLLYEICQVTEGSIQGEIPYRVYVRSGGTWEAVQDFVMSGTAAAVDVTFEARDAEAVAVFCMKNADLTYACRMAVAEPVQ